MNESSIIQGYHRVIEFGEEIDHDGWKERFVRLRQPKKKTSHREVIGI